LIEVPFVKTVIPVVEVNSECFFIRAQHYSYLQKIGKKENEVEEKNSR